MNFASNLPTDKLTVHRAYLPVYDRLFASIMGSPYSICEVGVDAAGSLVMWRDYFKGCGVVGVDINPCPKDVEFDMMIHHVQRDAYDVHCVQYLTLHEPFKLIIDDGSHALKDMVFFCREYPRLLSDNGLLIVEDVPEPSFVYQLAAALPEGFGHALIDLRTVNNRLDDLLFVAFRKL